MGFLYFRAGVDKPILQTAQLSANMQLITSEKLPIITTNKKGLITLPCGIIFSRINMLKSSRPPLTSNDPFKTNR